ncbi:MAG: hypothetical protein HW384_2124 [Dehalococcoidia bacterium]|nr:hypothetical protein [Dehalococcoidia bacterium]
MKTRTSWQQKLQKEAKIVDVPPSWIRRYGTGKMLIPRPLDLDALVRKVPKGKLVTQDQLREKLARDYKVCATCPLTSGLFIRIVAEAAEEDIREGKADITPYWRVIKPDGSLNEKFPGGVERQAARLGEEGHIIGPAKGRKPPCVVGFEKCLQEL